MRVHPLFPLLLLLVAVLPAGAQRVSSVPAPTTAVLPESITVGDVFHAAIRVQAPGDRRVFFPDTLAVPPEVESAGRRQIRVDTTSTGITHTAVYPLTAWRPDTVELAPAEIRVASASGEEVLTATFPQVRIRSVLPADTAGIEPQPAKDVLGPNRLWWPLLLLLALLLAAAALAYWFYRRRRPAPEIAAPVPLMPPRQRALEALDRARASGLVEAGAMKEFYSAVSDALRQYLDAVEPVWGADLTTSELVAHMRGRAGDVQIAEMLTILGEADLVKFARRRPGQEQALARWGAARAWVERFDWPPALPEAQAA
jgi:hypothetical protein